MPTTGIKLRRTGQETFICDETGEEYKIHGYGSMKNFHLNLDPRIDLTAPIYEQVLKLAAKDKAAEQRAKRKKRQTVAA